MAEFPFREIVSRVAKECDVPERALAVRTLLQLPRVARRDGELPRTAVEAEAVVSAQELAEDHAAFRLRWGWPLPGVPLGDLRFGRLDDELATDLFDRLHYLRQHRAGSVTYGLVDPGSGLPLAVCSVSPLEWRKAASLFRSTFGVPPEAVRDLSRVYAFDGAPAYSISLLLSKVRRDLARAKPEVALLSTVVDQNLGFTGSSYPAANWQLWLTARPRPYLYVDGRCRSPRQLRAAFGTSKPAQLRERLGPAFAMSSVALRNSLIYCCRLRGATESVPAEQVRVLHR